MASWTAPTTFATGDLLDVASANAWSNDLTFLYEAPYSYYYNSSATSLPSGTTTQVGLTSSLFANYGFSLSSNNAVLPLTGIYMGLFALQTSTTTSSVPTVAAFVYQNGTEKLDGSWVNPNGTTVASTGGGLLSGSANDTVGLYGTNTSGATLTTHTNSTGTYLSIAFVGSQ